jgi:hypothetical protein
LIMGASRVRLVWKRAAHENVAAHKSYFPRLGMLVKRYLCIATTHAANDRAGGRVEAQ